MSNSVQPHRQQPTRLPRPFFFSRQEHWSGLPFPSPMHESEKIKWSAQSCPTPSDPMDCSPPGPSVHEIFQARVLEWGAIAFSGLVASHVQLSATPQTATHQNPLSSTIFWSLLKFISIESVLLSNQNV